MSEGAAVEPTTGTTPDGTSWAAVGAGAPLVLVHGVGMNHAVWAPQMVAFGQQYRVIAPDLLGHGSSPGPSAEPRLTEFSDQLIGVLDHFELASATIVGHSLGAVIALDLALRWPQRVDRLVALNAVHGRTPEQARAVRERAARLPEHGVSECLDGTLARWFGPGAERGDREAVRKVRDWLLSVDRASYARAYQVFASADDHLAGRIGELQPPALFLTGELDPHSTPAMSRRLADEAQQGEAGVLTGERHMMAWESPVATNAAIDEFLARTDPSRAATASAARPGVGH